MSSPQQLYHQIQQTLKGFPKWGRPELVQTLAHMMVGIFMSRDVRLSQMAENVPLAIQEDSVAQRFRRWLKNPQVDERAIYDPIVRDLLFSLSHTRLRIQIDRTLIEDRFNVLVVSVYYRKRALPLVWKVLPHTGSSGFMDWCEILSHFAEIVPDNAEIVLLGDREFGQPDLMRLIKSYGWHFCLRCKRSYQVFYRGMWFKLEEWIPQQGQQTFFDQTTFTQTNPFQDVNWACAWAEDSDDPWLIATDLPPSKRILRYYAQRFACEELFSDIKKRGFNLENTRLIHPERFSKLFMVVALLYVWVMCIARQVRITRQDRLLTYRWQEERHSLFQIGRRWIKKQLTLGRLSLQNLQYQPWRLVYEK